MDIGVWIWAIAVILDEEACPWSELIPRPYYWYKMRGRLRKADFREQLLLRLWRWCGEAWGYGQTREFPSCFYGVGQLRNIARQRRPLLQTYILEVRGWSIAWRLIIVENASELLPVMPSSGEAPRHVGRRHCSIFEPIIREYGRFDYSTNHTHNGVHILQ